MKRYTLITAVWLAVLLLVGAGNVFAATHTWTDGGATNNWSDALNWDIGPPNSADDVVVFPTGDPTSIQNIPGLTIAAIQFTSSGNIITGTQPLTIDGNQAFNNIVNQTGNNEIDATVPLTIINNNMVVQITTGTLRIKSAISGSRALIKNGPGTLEFATTTGNTYTGATFINDGVLLLNTTTNDAGLSSAITVGDNTGAANSAVLRLVNSFEVPDAATISVQSDGLIDVLATGSEDITTLNLGSGVGGGNVAIATGGIFTIRSSGTVATTAAPTASTITGPGAFNLNATTPFNIADGAAASDLVISAPITGAGQGLTKTGAGTLELSNATATGNTYTGPTTIADGVLLLNTTTNDAGLSSAITVGDDTGAANSAVLRLAKSFQVPDAATISVQSDGLIDVLATGNEDITNLVLGSGVGGGNLAIAASGTFRIRTAGTVTTTAAPTTSVIAGPGQFIMLGTTVYTIGDGAATSDLVISAPIIGLTQGLTKTGSGVLTLSGSNSYTGATTINAGTLQVDGSIASSPLSLNNGTLSGIGNVGTVTANSGTIAPGGGVANGPGVLSSGNVSLNSGTTLSIELNGNTPGNAPDNHDQLNVTGTVALGGASLNAKLGIAPSASNQFVIINNDAADAVVGTFNGLPEGATFLMGGAVYQITYAGGTGNDVVIFPAATNLSVTKTDAPDPVVAGGVLTYTITVTNNGLVAANQVRLDNPTPTNTTPLSFTQTSGPAFNGFLTSTGFAATLATLQSGATAVFQVNFTVNPNTPAGTVINNAAGVTSNTPDPALANNVAAATTTVNTLTDLSLTQSDAADPVSLGSNLTYNLRVTNNGPSDAQTVTLTDTLPANTVFVAASQTSGLPFGLTKPAVGSTGTVTASIATLPVGGVATFEIVVKTNNSNGAVSNTATVSSTTPDANPANNSATEPTTVSVPSLAINDVSISEGNSGTSNAAFTVTLTTASTVPVAVNFALADGTATAGSDYQSASGAVVFQPGETAKVINVLINGDQINEANETFAVNLSGASNGLIADAQGIGTITNDDAAPAITLLTPANGPVGATVTITGSGFAGVSDVKFNGASASFFLVDSLTQIRAVVPSGATTGVVSVLTSGGTATSASPFTVTVPPPPPTPAPSVSLFAPGIGAIGSTVTIAGNNFTGATAVNFNNVKATSFTVVSNARITAIVPAAATTGKISVVTPAGTGSSAENFTVIPQPKITSFTPTSGVPGTTGVSGTVGTLVTITGANFTGTTRVLIGGVDTTFTVLSATQLRVPVPYGAITGKIVVTTPGGVATSAANFTVKPLITSFSVLSGTTGTVLVITGGAFVKVSSVKFNGVTAIFTGISYSQVRATVPLAATTGKITVTTPAGTATSATNFSVRPKITGFTPASGTVGTVVTINGSGFLGATTVKFGAGVATTRTVLSTTQIRATVPEGATTGKITVVTPTGTALSLTNFSVTAAPVAGANIGGATSPVALSSANARLATGAVSLTFTGAVDAESASDAAHYTVAVNGQPVVVESAGYNATSKTVTLSLPEGSLSAEVRVTVRWNGLQDTQGKTMLGQSEPVTAR